MLHYGKDYLKYMIESVNDVSDKIVILYSSNATHNPSALHCPDSKEELKEIAMAYPKVKWVNVVASSEGQHLSYAFRYADNYDVMIRSDYDEIWEPAMLEDAVRQTTQIKSRYIGIDGFYHFWRSFSWCNTDGFRPLRLHNLRTTNIIKDICIKSDIYHFGYAITESMMRYKWSCHGHHNEIRQGWMKKWTDWRPGARIESMHPVTDAYWHDLQPFDKAKFPEFMKSHPYYNLDVIL